MTDLDREMELFERSEARERRREARRNARLLQQAQRRDQARAGPAPDPLPVSRRARDRACDTRGGCRRGRAFTLCSGNLVRRCTCRGLGQIWVANALDQC